MSISPREKKLLGLCLAVAAVTALVLWTNLREPAANPRSFSREKLQEEKEKLNSFISVFRNKANIQAREDGIRQYLPSEKSAFDAQRKLNVKIHDIFQAHGIPPNIQPSRQRSISGVEEYRFLKFITEFKCDYQKTCDLLDAFDRNGFFIESLSISTQANNPRMTNIQCTVKVTLSRLVKLSAEELEKVKRDQQRRGLMQQRDKI